MPPRRTARPAPTATAAVRLLVLAALLGALHVAGLLHGPALVGAGPAWAQDGASIALTDEGPEPAVLEVAPGTSVTFTNERDQVVRIADDAGTWDSGPLEPGDTFSLRFDTAGEMTYASLDGSLAGTVVVTAPAAEDPTAAPTDGVAADPTEAPDPGGSPTPAETGAPVLGLGVLGLGAVALGLVLLRRT